MKKTVEEARLDSRKVAKVKKIVEEVRLDSGNVVKVEKIVGEIRLKSGEVVTIELKPEDVITTPSENPYEVEVTPDNWKDRANTPLIRIIVYSVVGYLWWVCFTACFTE